MKDNKTSPDNILNSLDSLTSIETINKKEKHNNKNKIVNTLKSLIKNLNFFGKKTDNDKLKKEYGGNDRRDSNVSENVHCSDKNHTVNSMEPFTNLPKKKADNDKSKGHDDSDRSNSDILANVAEYFKNKKYVDKEKDRNSIVYLDAKSCSFTDLREFFNITTDNDKQQADNFNLSENAVDVYKNNTDRLFSYLFKAFNKKIDNGKQRPKSISIRQKFLETNNSKNHTKSKAFVRELLFGLARTKMDKSVKFGRVELSDSDVREDKGWIVNSLPDNSNGSDKNNIAYLLNLFNSIETFNKKEKHGSNGSNNLKSGNADGRDKNNIVNLLNSFTDLLDKKTDNDKSKKNTVIVAANVDGSDKNNMVNLLDSIADCFDKKTAKSKKEHGAINSKNHITKSN
nr:13120_t:CDS:2 [Entrophospora candida]